MSSCWNWEARLDEKGYGRVDIKGRHRRPQRILWERVNGPIPLGFDLHHTCGNKRCCNPDHLIAISKAEHGKLHRPRKAPPKLPSPDQAIHNYLRNYARNLSPQPQPNSQKVRNGDKTHCKRGHPYDELNTIWKKDGKNRECHACQLLWRRAYRARQKAKAVAQRPGVKVELVIVAD